MSEFLSVAPSVAATITLLCTAFYVALTAMDEDEAAKMEDTDCRAYWD